MCGNQLQNFRNLIYPGPFYESRYFVQSLLEDWPRMRTSHRFRSLEREYSFAIDLEFERAASRFDTVGNIPPPGISFGRGLPINKVIDDALKCKLNVFPIKLDRISYEGQNHFEIVLDKLRVPRKMTVI